MAVLEMVPKKVFSRTCVFTRSHTGRVVCCQRPAVGSGRSLKSLESVLLAGLRPLQRPTAMGCEKVTSLRDVTAKR